MKNDFPPVEKLSVCVCLFVLVLRPLFLGGAKRGGKRGGSKREGNGQSKPNGSQTESRRQAAGSRRQAAGGRKTGGRQAQRQHVAHALAKSNLHTNVAKALHRAGERGREGGG
ncbi:uncharacterized protein [Drosophila pseudoobscura]|uniref:Uncharacterized protein isoform X2 n=1 Tax=Drosophila pseudoobscura pseudoobscura TaxID=46245 RepID=A0A6I8W6Q1_DROPS|nr:uncharacterized protein LOC26532124 isoform X2 [Drosophila pseudoobscura]